MNDLPGQTPPAATTDGGHADDSTTTVAQLRRRVEQFVDQRDWRQFHSPKNLAMSLAIEAAELMEHFQWLTIQQSRGVTGDSARMERIGDELADVFCYLLAMTSQLDLDLTEATVRKLAKNELKYPADEYRGRFGPDDPGTPERPAQPERA